jgi:hypothetical protein
MFNTNSIFDRVAENSSSWVAKCCYSACKDGGKKVAMHPTKLQAAAQSIMQDAATNCSLHAV